MNQEQVKNKLLELENNIEDFNLLFSGKKSKKVNGLYTPQKKEIIIHNKNFDDDNLLIYTAIHEFAHHIHHTKAHIPVSARSHSNDFWCIFQKLLIDAEDKGIYNNIFKDKKEFTELTKEIKENYLSKNAQLMKDFGKLLIKAIELCKMHKVRFEDYVDRELLLTRQTADTAMKIYTMNIDTDIGLDNMKALTRVKDNEKRRELEEEIKDGKTHEFLKAELKPGIKTDNSKDILEKERVRLERTIEKLREKLDVINEKIKEYR